MPGLLQVITELNSAVNELSKAVCTFAKVSDQRAIIYSHGPRGRQTASS